MHVPSDQRCALGIAEFCEMGQSFEPPIPPDPLLGVGVGVFSQNVVGKRRGCLLQISEIKSKKQRDRFFPHQRYWGGLSQWGGK